MIKLSEAFINRLEKANHIAVLTGAGISAESGIKTFRDPDGFWAKFNPAELASAEGFMSNPKLVAEWYKMRKDAVDNTEPNPGHYALAELEKYYRTVSIATQNVDRLHHRAGSTNIDELHGNIVTNRCFDCGEPFEGETLLLLDGSLPKCPICGGKIRPNVIWFGEMLPQDALASAEISARQCDIYFSAGTGAEVYPAGNLPIIAKQNGAFLVEVNPTRTVISDYCDEVISERSGIALPAIIEEIKKIRNILR